MTFTFTPRQVWDRAQKGLHEPLVQQRLVLIVVCIVLLLDNMLYMVIVPIIPDYLSVSHDTGVGDRDLAITYLSHDSGVGDRDLATTRVGDRDLATTYISHNTGVGGTYLATTDAPSSSLPVSEYSNFSPSYSNTSIPPSPPASRTSGGGAIGFLFASKAIVQLCVNPFSGALIDRIGYSLPLMIGLVVMFISTTVFAFGESYVVLLLARSVQGIGSAFADTAGLAMIADRFTEKAERTKALGIALAFISFGCLFAPPFGGVLYQFAGKTVPFLILASVCLLDGLLLLMVTKPAKLGGSTPDSRPKGAPIYRLLLDPYIAVCAGALAMSNVSLAFLEPTISLWMKERMDADQWEMGFIWLPAFLPHVAGVYMTVKLARSYPQHQWLMAALGLAMEGVFCCAIPFAQQFFVVVFPIMGICFGIALVDTALLPMLAHLVDVRHTSVYGSVYAIADIAYCLAYALGPIVAGSVVHAIGFFWLNVLICLTNVLFAPVMLVVRNVYRYQRLDNEEEALVVEKDSEGHADYKTCVQGKHDGDGRSTRVTCYNHNFGSHLMTANQQPVSSGSLNYYPLASCCKESS